MPADCGTSSSHGGRGAPRRPSPGTPEPSRQATGVSFTVHGDAAPQGSKRAIRHRTTGNIVMMESSKRLRPWRQEVAAVAAAAIEARGGKPLEGALGLDVTFYRQQPKSAKKRKYPHTRPDSSKLLRAIEDAMEGIVYADDAQICLHIVRKAFGEPRAEIEVWQLP